MVSPSPSPGLARTGPTLGNGSTLHGVEMERTATPITQEFETYRFSNISSATGGDGIGRAMYNFEARAMKEKITIAQGAYWVPAKQRRARLILATLEPEAPDSLARYGFMYAAITSSGRGGGGRGRGGAGGRGRGGANTAPQAERSGGAPPSPYINGVPAEYLTEPIARKTMADNPDLAKQQVRDLLPLRRNQVTERHPRFRDGVDLIVNDGLDVVLLGDILERGGPGDDAGHVSALERVIYQRTTFRLAHASGQIDRRGRTVTRQRGHLLIGFARSFAQRFGIEQDGVDGVRCELARRCPDCAPCPM